MGAAVKSMSPLVIMCTRTLGDDLTTLTFVAATAMSHDGRWPCIGHDVSKAIQLRVGLVPFSFNTSSPPLSLGTTYDGLQEQTPVYQPMI